MRKAWLLLAMVLIGGDSSSQASGAEGSGNPRNDRLLAMPEASRAQFLGDSFKRGCVGVSTFPMGVTASGKGKGNAYWSVRCKNGKSYVIQIPADPKYPSIVEDCRVLEGTGRECFKKF